jgi:hypothetical protein
MNEIKFNNTIKNLRKNIPCPVIDVISYETFDYTMGSEEVYGGIDEKLTFNWRSIPHQENVRRKMDLSSAIRFVIVRIINSKIGCCLFFNLNILLVFFNGF